jgi:hypothetical protein
MDVAGEALRGRGGYPVKIRQVAESREFRDTREPKDDASEHGGDRHCELVCDRKFFPVAVFDRDSKG